MVRSVRNRSPPVVSSSGRNILTAKNFHGSIAHTPVDDDIGCAVLHAQLILGVLNIVSHDKLCYQIYRTETPVEELKRVFPTGLLRTSVAFILPLVTVLMIFIYLLYLYQE